MKAPQKCSSQHENPANKVKFSTIPVDLWDVTQSLAVLLFYQQLIPLNNCKQTELEVLLQSKICKLQTRLKKQSVISSPVVSAAYCFTHQTKISAKHHLC